MCVFLTAGNLAGFNEGWRLTNARRTGYTWGYGTQWNHYNYAFCYDPTTSSTLDSLSITHWLVNDDGEQPHQYLQPFVADFSTVLSANSYTIRTAIVTIDSGLIPRVRQYTRDLNGRWLEDNLFNTDGTHLWRKQYFYDAQGRVSSIRLSDFEVSTGPGEWLMEYTYDAAGRRINQYIYKSAGHAWIPKYRCLYHYVEGEVLPSSYRISENAPYLCRKWDYLGVEAFSDFKLDRIYVNTHNGTNWVFDYAQFYFEYSYNGSELFVRRQKYFAQGYWDQCTEYYMSFRADGMPIRDGVSNQYADAYSSTTVIYTWEEAGETAVSEELATPVVLRLDACPNPFLDSVTFKAEAPILNLSVYDLRGRLVHTRSASSQSLNWQALDPQGRPLPAGIYFIRATTPHGVITRKVLKKGN